MQPLSRQHHQGLLMVLLLQKGLQKNADVNQMQEFLVAVWNSDLESHFNQEEKHLLPLLKDKPIDPQLTARIWQDHAVLREMAAKAESGSLNEIEIGYFAERLEQHIRFEERTYFPAAEQVLSAAELEQLGESLIEKEGNCMNYPVKFWE
jgi:hemerythrin-like domain-containing protein